MSRTNWLILALALLAAIAGGYVGRRHSQAPPATASPLIGQRAPEIVLSDLQGKLHALSDYRGRRVLLNFWASWCGPCLEEMPILAGAQDNFDEKGSIVVGIAMDAPLRVRRFLDSHPVSYPILLGKLSSPSTSLLLGNEEEVLPYSVLMGADGRILATQPGALTAAQVEEWLHPETTVH